jgi:hypothetical protein
MLPTLDSLPPELSGYLTNLPPMMQLAARAMLARNPSMGQRLGANPPGLVNRPAVPARPTLPPTANPTAVQAVATGGPDPTRALPPERTGGPLPPAETVPRAGGLLVGPRAAAPRTDGNTGIVPPTMPTQARPGAAAMTSPVRAPGLPAMPKPRAVSASYGLPAPAANPVGRPAAPGLPRVG